MRQQDSPATDPRALPLLFNDTKQRKRYICALGMILLMVAVAEILHEKEILFPEMAALAIGMWIVDKRVWKVKRWQQVPGFLLCYIPHCRWLLMLLWRFCLRQFACCLPVHLCFR